MGTRSDHVQHGGVCSSPDLVGSCSLSRATSPAHTSVELSQNVTEAHRSVECAASIAPPDTEFCGPLYVNFTFCLNLARTHGYSDRYTSRISNCRPGPVAFPTRATLWAGCCLLWVLLAVPCAAQDQGSTWNPKHTPEYGTEPSESSPGFFQGPSGDGLEEGGRVLRGGQCDSTAWSLPDSTGIPGSGLLGGPSTSGPCGPDGCPSPNKVCCDVKNKGFECKNENACKNQPGSTPIPLGGPLWALLLMLSGGGYGAYRLRGTHSE